MCEWQRPTESGFGSVPSRWIWVQDGYGPQFLWSLSWWSWLLWWWWWPFCEIAGYGGRKLCRGWSCGISVLVDESVAAGDLATRRWGGSMSDGGARVTVPKTADLGVIAITTYQRQPDTGNQKPEEVRKDRSHRP